MKIRNTVALMALFFLLSCTRSSDNTATQDEVLASGSWRVTLFTDSGNNETSDFSGYSFSFNTGGSLAVTGTQTKTGTWSRSSSSSKFIIDLGPKSDANKPLGELTDDWRIVSITGTEIQLKDDNDASEELLTFTKN
jgi:hypothetical protein